MYKPFKMKGKLPLMKKPCPGCKTMCAGCKGKKAVPTDTEAIKARKKKYMKTGK